MHHRDLAGIRAVGCTNIVNFNFSPSSRMIRTASHSYWTRISPRLRWMRLEVSFCYNRIIWFLFSPVGKIICRGEPNQLLENPAVARTRAISPNPSQELHNRSSSPYPTLPPTLPGTPNRLPPTSNSPISHLSPTPYLGKVDLPALSPSPSPPWNEQKQLPAVDGYNHYPSPSPTPSPTLPGTSSRLPPTPNNPLSSLPSSPRFRIDASLMQGYYDVSNEYNVSSDRSLLNAVVDQYTSSLVLVLPRDLGASDILVTPSTSSPYIIVFDVVTAIRKALYTPSQRSGQSSRLRLVDSLRGRTRISLRDRQAGPQPVLGVEFS